MQKRKSTPDILSDLMNEPNTNTPVNQHTNVSASTDKTKATYYISQVAVSELEEVWQQLRKTAPPALKGEISKSLIVDIALKIVLEDFRQWGAKSQLANKTLHHKTNTV
jgi:hypothetical protein